MKKKPWLFVVVLFEIGEFRMEETHTHTDRTESAKWPDFDTSLWN